MGKLKTFFSNQKEELKGLVYNYMITLIAVAVLSVLWCIELEIPYDSTATLEDIMLFLMNFAVGAFFIETIFIKTGEQKPKDKLLIAYLIDFLVALVWTIIIQNISDVSKALADVFGVGSANIVENVFARIYGVYMVFLLGVAIYKIIKKNNIEVGTYLARACFGLLKVWGLFLVLYIAMICLLGIFDTLIFEIEYWDILDNLTILLAGFLYFPYSLLMITNTDEENSRFTKGLVNFVLMPCVLAAIVIVYMYILKIVFTAEMPENEVFDICLCVFVYGGPFWLMSYDLLKETAAKKGEELGIYGKIVKNTKYIYAPIIILEIVAIGMRISTYGLTEARYAGIIAILFQIFYILWEQICKLISKKKQVSDKQENLILAAIVFLAFFLLCPVLNIYKLPYMVQKARYEKSMENEDYVTASGCYDYLRYTEFGNAYLKEEYTEQEREELEKLFYETMLAENQGQEFVEEFRYFSRTVSYEKTREGFSVEGYTNIYPFIYEQDNARLSEEDLKCICVTYYDGTCQANLDVSELVDMCTKKNDMGYYDTYEDMGYQYISLSPNYMLVIEEISFRHYTYSKEVTDLRIEGFFLTNEKAHSGQ